MSLELPASRVRQEEEAILLFLCVQFSWMQFIMVIVFICNNACVERSDEQHGRRTPYQFIIAIPHTKLHIIKMMMFFSLEMIKAENQERLSSGFAFSCCLHTIVPVIKYIYFRTFYPRFVGKCVVVVMMIMLTIWRWWERNAHISCIIITLFKCDSKTANLYSWSW